MKGKEPNELIPVSQGGKCDDKLNGYNRKTVYKYNRIWKKIQAVNNAFNELVIELVGEDKDTVNNALGLITK